MSQVGYRTMPSFKRRVSREKFATGFYQLSRFLSVGVSLTEGLEDLKTGASDRIAGKLWGQLGRSVESGKSLSEALVDSGVDIENTVLSIIRSGEANAQLDSACQAVSEYLRWHIELRQRIVTLLVYPLFSLCVLVAVTGFLLISVVPAVKGFLLSAGRPLEWHTIALLNVSEWISLYVMHLLSIFGVFIAGVCILVILSPRIRSGLDRLTLRLPLLGAVLTDLLLSRYAQCCARLYASGIALEKSLQLAEQGVLNSALRTDLVSARIRMMGGASLSDALSQVSILPPMFRRLVAVGERSGQLSIVLEQLGKEQSRAVEVSISRMEQLIGPVLLLCIGSVLMWIVVSMLGPVYSMAVSSVTGAT